MAIAYGPSIISNGLVLLVDSFNPRSYPGTGTTWFDISPTKNNGTINSASGSPVYSSGPNGGFTFSSANTANIRFSRPASGDFSLCIWFKATGNSTSGTQWHQGEGLLDCEVGGNTVDYGLNYLNNKAALGIGNSDTTFQSSTLINTGAWFFIVGTRIQSSGAIALYINSVLETTGSASTSALTAPTFMYMGSSNGGVGSYGGLPGVIGLAQVYNRALTASEILLNFRAHRGRFGV